MDFLTQASRDLFFSYTQTGDLLLDSEICEHYEATRPQKQKKRKKILEQNGILVESEKENHLHKRRIGPRMEP